jgi:hypothetical protein
MFVLNEFALHDLQVGRVLAERPAFLNIKVILQLGLQLAPDLLVHKLVIFTVMIDFQFFLVNNHPHRLNLFVRNVSNFFNDEIGL